MATTNHTHKNINLPADVAGKYDLNPELKKIPKIFRHHYLGLVNMENITLAKAQSLALSKTPYLILKKQSKNPSSK